MPNFPTRSQLSDIPIIWSRPPYLSCSVPNPNPNPHEDFSPVWVSLTQVFLTATPFPCFSFFPFGCPFFCFLPLCSKMFPFQQLFHPNPPFLSHFSFFPSSIIHSSSQASLSPPPLQHITLFIYFAILVYLQITHSLQFGFSCLAPQCSNTQ